MLLSTAAVSSQAATIHTVSFAGALPASWSNLTALSELRISNAPSISGPLPTDWVASLKLQRLELSNLSLSVPLSVLSGMPTLTSLTLRHLPNATLPAAGMSDLAVNSSLSDLIVRNVGGWTGMSLDPSIPTRFPNISRLALMQLGLVGSIPASWQSLRPMQLQGLYLSSNSLNGTLPSWLASRLAPGGALDLTYNNFTGKGNSYCLADL